jgi:hypothetical protein
MSSYITLRRRDRSDPAAPAQPRRAALALRAEVGHASRVRLVVTTPLRSSPEEEQAARRAAARWGFPFVARATRTVVRPV